MSQPDSGRIAVVGLLLVLASGVGFLLGQGQLMRPDAPVAPGSAAGSGSGSSSAADATELEAAQARAAELDRRLTSVRAQLRRVSAELEGTRARLAARGDGSGSGAGSGSGSGMVRVRRDRLEGLMDALVQRERQLEEAAEQIARLQQLIAAMEADDQDR